MLYTNKLKSEVEKMAKYCTKCGIRMDDNDMVCPECGMQQGGYASPQEMQSIDGMRPQESNGKSVASLVLGIVGVIAWCLPILGLPVGVIGLIMGIQGYNREWQWQELCLALSVWFLRLSIVLSVRIWDLRECCLTDFCDDMK